MRPKALALAVLASCAVSMANDIEPSKEFYTAVRAPAAIVVDGNLTEWSGAPILADPRIAVRIGQEGVGGAPDAGSKGGGGADGNYVLFERYAGGTWSGPDDHTSAVQVVYDNDNVYFGFVVTDDTHENNANSAWNGDSVQLMIASADRTTEFALYNYALGGVEGALGEVIVNHERGGAANVDCACDTTAVVRRDAAAKRTYYEIKLPAKAVGLTPPLTAGTKFGLGMAINDGDIEVGQEGQKGWGGLGAHAIVFGKTPSETALVTLGASQTTTEILGAGLEFLLGGDLTDPENDGDEAAGPASPTWNWAGITSSHEPSFDNGEAAFNIFDNKVGPGNDKWCCDDPTVANPVWVAVQFVNPVSLTHFTVTSGNDAADRDPVNWAIQGSSDGVGYTDIYKYDAATALWTERLQVIKFTLPTPSAPYRYIRYIAYHTPGTLHQINEVEYFGTFGTADRFFLSSINPTFESFTFRATDVGPSIVAPATARLTIDGQQAPLTNVKTGDATDFTHKPAAPLPPLSQHSFSIAVSDTLGNSVTSTGTFQVIAYALLTAADRVTADTTKPGFIWRVHQNEAFQATVNSRTIDQLAGLLGENLADPAAQGPAIAPGVPGANTRLPITFEIDTVINMNQDGGGAAGDITPDDQLAGVPGTTGSNNGIAAEILTFIDLPAGKHTLIVNSDDAFRTVAGKIDDIFLAQVAGEFNAGRGAADTAYTVYAQDAGVYPFKTLWNEGGGGANIEWKVVKSDGTEVLINDRANGGLSAYRAATGPSPTVITAVTPAVNANKAAGNTPIEVIIREGASAVVDASARFVINGTQVTPTVTRSGSTVTLRHQPATAFAANTTNTVTVNFTQGTSPRTATWSFSIPRSITDEISNRTAFVLGSANFTADRGGHSGQAGDRGMDFGMGTANTAVLVPDGSFLNAETADDTLTFSIWVKKTDLANNSAFWADSPSSPQNQRGYQAHVPWSDNSVYFDSAGCCVGEETRINAPIDTAVGYTGPEWVTNTWHHWVFVKDTALKRIYIDGQLFLEGGGSTPLPTDFARIWLGAEGGGPDRTVNIIHGVLDDFAVFGTALSAADVGRLFTGTLPSALGAATRPLAHWDFNEAPIVSEPPRITGITRAANGSITVTWTGGGQLDASPSVSGPWIPVSGATTGTYTFMPQAAQPILFGRIRRAN